MDELGGGLFEPLDSRQFKRLWTQFQDVVPFRDDHYRLTDNASRASWQWPLARHSVHTRKDLARAGVNVVEWWERPELEVDDDDSW